MGKTVIKLYKCMKQAKWELEYKAITKGREDEEINDEEFEKLKKLGERLCLYAEEF
jgi:hypothetical protein